MAGPEKSIATAAANTGTPAHRTHVLIVTSQPHQTVLPFPAPRAWQ
jgi:hypothetical protein